MNKVLSFYILLFPLLVGMLISHSAFGQSCNSNDPSSPLGVTPDFVLGNPPLCSGGFRIDPPASGTYNLDAYNQVVVTVSSTSCGQVVSWSVSGSIVVDHVIVKGGPDANDYDYTGFSPRPTSDGGLHAPVLSNGKYAGLSHIDFCYHYQLDVSKTANTAFKRTYQWTIEKSVQPASWNLFNGDEGTSKYTITVDKTGFVDSDWKATGNIYIANNTPFAVTIASVSDQITPGINVTADCGVSFPYTLASGASLTCSYEQALPDGTNRTNEVTVVSSTANVQGGTATAAVDFSSAVITEVNPSINVTDVSDKAGIQHFAFSDDGTASYYVTFACGDDAGSWDNTATIDETGQSDDASVTVNCYQLSVAKNAATELDRTWYWNIDKTCPANLTLAVGQTYTVTYGVVVGATSIDDNWKVTGNISVGNAAPLAATLNGVADLVSPALAASVDCGVSFPYSLAAGATLNCSYSANLPDAASRTNTATATQQNYSYDYLGAPTPDGTTDYSGTAAVGFGAATVHEIDACIDVSDSYAGALGTVCYDDLPASFSYSRNLVYSECGSYTVLNTASFVTNTTQTAGSDDCNIDVYVPCTGEGGCTLTPGYWKTHSEFGPAPYDDTWAQLPNGASTPFFLSGQSHYQVLWTAPAGNAYYILARAYIAAKLNFLNGSDPAAAQAAFDAATVLFSLYTPAQVATMKGKAGNDLRQQFISLASVLDNYNNGLIGPGHCSEETTNGSREALSSQVVTQPSTKLELYPNPASYEVQVNLSEFVGQAAKLQVFDQTGALVWSESFASVTAPVYTLQLEPARFAYGVYYVSLQSKDRRISNVLLVNAEK